MMMKAMLMIPVAMLATGLTACIPKADAEQASGTQKPSYQTPVDPIVRPPVVLDQPFPDDSGICKENGFDKHIGKKLTAELESQIKREAGASLVRVAPEAGVITMDYNTGRVNIFHDDKDVIVRIKCG
jgi:hypothetical protein